jgi:hypothetical protein
MADIIFRTEKFKPLNPAFDTCPHFVVKYVIVYKHKIKWLIPLEISLKSAGRLAQRKLRLLLEDEDGLSRC